MANTICLPKPNFLIPVDNLVQMTIDKTHIKPAMFQAPRFNVPTPPTSFQLQVNVQLPPRPPNGPFRFIIEHPFFVLESPIFYPHDFEEKERKCKKRRSWKKEQKKNIKERREANVSNQEVTKVNNSEIVQFQKHKFVEECIHKALMEHCLNQYLIYFKTVESSVHSSLEKSSNNKMGSTKIEDLIQLIKDLRGLIESVENFYEEKEHELSEMEDSKQFQEILGCVSRLQTILEQLNASDIPGLLEENIDKKEEHMLCSILGLEDEIAEYLINLDADVRNHQTDEHWILDFLNKKEEQIADIKDTKTCLTLLGFRASKAGHLANKISQNCFSDHQTITYWAKLYIEQQFFYHILLSSHRDVPCIQNQTLDKEYSIETVDDEDKTILIPAVDTKMLSEDQLTSSKWVKDYLSQKGDTLDGSTYWFHGTDHKSAINIMENGIDLDRGKAGGDFSDGRGFYLTSDYKFAHLWPQKLMRKPNSAVIVFKLKKDVFSSRKGRKFSDDSEEWRNTVGFFRSGKDYKWVNSQRKKGKELLGYPYIFGPISKDGNDRKIQNWSPRARKPKVFELCLKDDLLAEDFYDSGHNIHKILFFF